MAESAGPYRNVIQATEEFGELAHRFFFDLANHLYPHRSQPPGTLFPGATLPIDGDQLARIARRAPNTKTHSTPLPRPTPPHYPPTRLVNSVLAITLSLALPSVAAPQTHWTKVVFAVLGTGSNISLDYVIRRLYAFSAGLKTG